MTRYITLLRGINVGGHAKVSMDDLRRLFLHLGYTGVTTYIQSGNILFTTAAHDPAQLTSDIEQALARELDLTITVLLRSLEEITIVTQANPFLSRGVDPTKLHVTFLRELPLPTRIAQLQPPASTPDEYIPIGREIYLHCPHGYGNTKLNNAFFERQLQVPATTRTWNTILKLHGLAQC